MVSKENKRSAKKSAKQGIAESTRKPIKIGSAQEFVKVCNWRVSRAE